MRPAKTYLAFAVLFAGLFLAGTASVAVGGGRFRVGAVTKVLTVSSERYEVRILPKKRDDLLAEIEVQVTDLRRNTTASVFLSSHNEFADEIHSVGDRFVVIGTLYKGGRGGSVAVIDPSKPAVVFETWCFDPVVAPDGRHIVFEKWYAPYGMAAWPEIHVIDVDSAEQGPVRVYPAHGMPQDFAEDWSSPVYGVVSPKVWSDDGKTLAFFSIYWISGDWRSHYDVYCVVVDFEEGKTPKTYSAPVMVSDFVKPGATPEYVAFYVFRLQIEDGELVGKLGAEGYIQNEKGEFVSEFTPQPHWKQDTIRVPLDSVRKQILITAD